MTNNLSSFAEKSKYVIPKKSDRRLLILSCSRKKKAGIKLMPAIERYDGPAFQVLRKFIVECPTEFHKLDIYIISAKFGMIPANQPIPWYDMQMGAHRAMDLNPIVSEEMKLLLMRRKYQKLMINVGKNYLFALAGCDPLWEDDLEVTYAAGSSGRRQSILRDWLRGAPPPNRHIHLSDIVCIRGKKLSLTADQVIDIACRVLSEQKDATCCYQSWYVPINGHRVSPKWLVSQLTGLPVRAFHSDDARRVLLQLGLKVCHI